MFYPQMRRLSRVGGSALYWAAGPGPATGVAAMKIQVILEPNHTMDELVELGQLAEAQGLDALWVQNYAAAMDPFMSLVPLARATRRIRLGVVVVSPQELHPLKLANQLVTLNEISGGRGAVVVGRGGEWLGMMGVAFTPRVQALAEALDIIRRMARGEARQRPLSTQGEHYRAQYFSTPWLSDVPPATVYAGVTRDRMLAMSAGPADGVMLADLAVPRVVAERVRHLEQALAEAGRPRADMLINDFVGWHVKDDAEVAQREARRELIIRAWLGPYWLSKFLEPDENEFVQKNKNAFIKAFGARTHEIEGIPEPLIARLIDGLTITGSRSRIDAPLERLNALKAAGLDEIALRLHDEPAAAIRLIGELVVPAFH